jgi:hypothetical protein
MNGEGLLREDSLPTPSPLLVPSYSCLPFCRLNSAFSLRVLSLEIISFHNFVISVSHTVHIGDVYFFRRAFGVLRSLNRWNPLSEVNFLDCSPRVREFISIQI